MMRAIFLGTFGLAVLVGSLGCSDSTPAPAQVIVDANLQSGAGGTCPAVSDGFLIGNLRRPDKPTTSPIRTGDQYEGSDITVECKVIPRGDGFEVNLRANRRGKGEIRIFGKENFKDTGKQSNVTATLTLDGYGSFIDTGCSVEYYHASQPNYPEKDIAGGRIWGYLQCPKLTRSDIQPAQVCSSGDTMFRFENCDTE